jgi:hypothetical protein
MKALFKKFSEKPIYVLIAFNVIIGLFTFREYGLSWDEPFFYDYGDALGYAYSPREWFSGHFDLNNSYGASGDDHKTRGPAYLFLARNFVYGLTALGSDSASAWHLVNFLFFQLGIYFLYRISTRWVSAPAAFLASVSFSFQPMLWGHAFVNPKDPPFLTFFLASVCLGFEMADAISENAKNKRIKILLAAFVLGIATSIRVLGPLAGLLVLIYSLSKTFSNHGFIFRTSAAQWIKTSFPSLVGYGMISIAVMFAAWPYLWESPIARFVQVFLLMSDNPTTLPVLFRGEIYLSADLPRRYLPFMLITTLTEPIFPLFISGFMAGYWKLFQDNNSSRAMKWHNFITYALILLWFAVLVGYVLIRRPAMYDGMRHFLFILPPLFIISGFSFEFFLEKARRVTKSLYWLHAGAGLALILPGAAGIIQLHPYEYAYYNSFVGGTSGVFRKYETEYWLTCYKEAVEQLNQMTNEPTKLYVNREAYIAATYADENIHTLELRGAHDQVTSGDYVLVNTRSNEDLSTFSDAPNVIQVKRRDAIFCFIRQIP